MARTAQIYEYALAVGEVEIILADGGFYKLLSASGNVTIAREGGSSIGPLLPGQGEREDFKRLTITNTSGAVNNIRLLVADKSFEDTRIYGNVEVVDGGRAITMAENSFGGFVSQSASVGNYSHLQLWNPVGRTVNIAVSSLVLTTFTAGGSIQLRWYATPLATLWANPNSKKFGSPNSGAELRQETPAVFLGAGANLLAYQPAQAAIQYQFKEPIVLVPGMGLVVVHGQVNSQISASFDFYEFTP